MIIPNVYKVIYLDVYTIYDTPQGHHKEFTYTRYVHICTYILLHECFVTNASLQRRKNNWIQSF